MRPGAREHTVAGRPAIDSPGYLGSLDGEGVRTLASWLAVEGLRVGEFIEVVDRAYALAPPACGTAARSFVKKGGRHFAATYARRKRRFAGLAVALEAARLSGALPGEVALHELRPLAGPSLPAVSVGELIEVLEGYRLIR